LCTFNLFGSISLFGEGLGGFSAFENVVMYASKNEGLKYLNNKAVKYVKTIIAQ
jgi:hypothetical protein